MTKKDIIEIFDEASRLWNSGKINSDDMQRDWDDFDADDYEELIAEEELRQDNYTTENIIKKLRLIYGIDTYIPDISTQEEEIQSIIADNYPDASQKDIIYWAKNLCKKYNPDYLSDSIIIKEIDSIIFKEATLSQKFVIILNKLRSKIRYKWNAMKNYSLYRATSSAWDEVETSDEDIPF